MGIQPAHVELYIRSLGETGLMASSTNTMLQGVRGFFRSAHIDGPIPADPAVYARLPKIHSDESRTQGLDRLELIRFLQVAQTITVHHGALAYLLGINALRASEAAAVRIEDYAETLRGHRVLHLVGKGDKPATMPLTVPVLRVLRLAAANGPPGSCERRAWGRRPHPHGAKGPFNLLGDVARLRVEDRRRTSASRRSAMAVLRKPDRDAFSAFASARSGSLFRIAYLVMGDYQLAQDLVQESLTKTYLAWPRLRDVNNADAYTRRVIVNTSISWRRRRSFSERPAETLPDRGVIDPSLSLSRG